VAIEILEQTIPHLDKRATYSATEEKTQLQA